MELLVILVLAFIVFVIIAFVKGSREIDERNKNRTERETTLSKKMSALEESGFSVDRNIFGNDFDFALAVDNEHYKWAVVYPSSDEPHIFNFQDLISYEIIQNGEKAISGNAGDAAASAILFGTAGAIVGASSKKTISEMCHDLHIEIRVNDLNKSLLILPCSTGEIAVNCSIFQDRVQKAHEILSILSYIKSNAEHTNKDIPDFKNASEDIYDELEKLHGLKGKGIITEEEFQKKKESLLQRLR